MLTGSLAVIPEILNAESSGVLQPEDAAHVVLEGRKDADSHTTTISAARPSVPYELTWMSARRHNYSFTVTQYRIV